MNLCQITEMETALKNLLIYTLSTSVDSAVTGTGSNQEMASLLSSEDYFQVLKIGSEKIWSQLKPESTNLEDLKTAVNSLLLNSSLEKYVNFQINQVIGFHFKVNPASTGARYCLILHAIIKESLLTNKYK